ncbi:hypothetical protein ACO2Q8_26115 [Larkinella sp. VNQ87]|uniref:hypothetical protein n=1 Tax=Larkinella sp. VNQ87 TaxID=3400921 RepID=UPI003C06DC88
MGSSTLELKLDSIDLTLPNRERSLYFILSATTPDNPDHLMVTVLPDSGFLKLGKHQSSYHFAPAGDEDGGLFLLSTALPASNTVLARLWVMESMAAVKEIGQILSGITGFVQNQVTGSKLFQTIGGLNPVVLSGVQTVSNGLGQIGTALSKLGDRQLGFVSMDQHFTDSTPPTLTCQQTMMSGNGSLTWSWLSTTTSPVAATPV